MDHRTPRVEPAWDTPASPVTAAAAAPRRLDLRFTGSGSEYFRIWIVNLLLTLLTLTLYAPFAKVRRLRWQYANTLVDGQPLAFHGDPWKMLRGHLLILLFGACYVGAGRLSATAGLIASAALAALWPALWQSSLRFRLANTSWRGLPLQFTGSVGDAYAALAPMLVPAALALASVVRPADPQGGPPPWLALGPLLLMLGTPWLLARMKRYQHGHCQWAGQTTRLDATTGQFYKVYLRVAAWTMLPMLVLGIVAAILAPVARQLQVQFSLAATVLTVLFLGYGLAVVLGQAMLLARLQNLVWGRTATAKLRFHSALKTRRVVAQLARNLLFSALTLGLYWPFGWVRLTAMRLASLHIEAADDPARWIASTTPSAGSAAGDAAGDLLNIDVGL